MEAKFKRMKLRQKKNVFPIFFEQKKSLEIKLLKIKVIMIFKMILLKKF